MTEHLATHEQQQTLSFDQFINTTGPVAFMQSSVQFLKNNPEEWQAGRYTEIHIMDGQPFMVVSPWEPSKQGHASIGGHHSVLDEIRVHDDGKYPRFMAAIDDLSPGLGTKTVIAKGLLSPDVNGAANLALTDIRNRNELEWLQALRVNKVDTYGIDGKVEVGNYGAKELFNTAETLQLLDVYSNIEKITGLPEGTITSPDMTSGILAGVELGEPQTSRDGNFNLKRRQSIGLQLATAHSVMHDPIYEAKGMNTFGLQDIFVDGQLIRMGLRFSDDKRFGSRRINFFFDRDYGDLGAKLQKRIVQDFDETVFGYEDNSPIDVTVSHFTGKPQHYLFERQ